jgi:uncharacterized phage protein (TIGR02218 family)
MTHSDYAAEFFVQQGSDETTLVMAAATTYAEGWFRFGEVVWLSGRNIGLRTIVRDDRTRGDGRREITLWSPAAFRPEVGDRFRLMAGCDKTEDTCRNKFKNFLNFRGFPHIPGEDWIMGYPRSGTAHDGSSLRRR